MNRREMMALIGGAGVLPVAARAQSMPVIGYLDIQSANGFEPYVGAFRQGIKETGFVEGQNLVFEQRFAD